MMHDGTGDDVAGGGGGEGSDGGEGCSGEDDGEDNEEEEEEDFLDDILRHVEQELLSKGLNNLEMVQKARKERLYPEEKGSHKRWSLLRFMLTY
jgi:TATA-binding protein-associated factor Taf7